MREKKFGKRCLTWVLVLMMTLSLLPVSAMAEDGEARFYGKNVTIIHDCDTYMTAEESDGSGGAVMYEGESEVLPEPIAEPKWAVSRSKTATALDANDESRVTLSLPSAEEKLVTDVVFVLDKSRCKDETGKAAMQLAQELLTQQEVENVKLKVGVVIFGGTAIVTRGLEEVTQDNKEDLENALRAANIGGLHGSNIQSGLIEADKMLSADRAVANNRKYVVLISDGHTYQFSKEGDYYDKYSAGTVQFSGLTTYGIYSETDAYSYYVGITSTIQGLGDEYYTGDYGANGYDQRKRYYMTKEEYQSNNRQAICTYQMPYGIWAEYLEHITEVVEKDKDQYVVQLTCDDSGNYNDMSIGVSADISDEFRANRAKIANEILSKTSKNGPDDEGNYYIKCGLDASGNDNQLMHASGNDRSVYEAYSKYVAMAKKYQCYPIYIKHSEAENKQDYGYQLMHALGEISHNTGTDLRDPTGSITTPEISNIFESIKEEILYAVGKGSIEYDKMGDAFDFGGLGSMLLTVGDEELTPVIDADDPNVAYFGAKDDKQDIGSGNYRFKVTYEPKRDAFEWTLNEHITNFTRVQLTYTVKLVNRETRSGTYEVPTNGETYLIPVDSNNIEGAKLPFTSPTVSYTVSRPHHTPTPSTPTVESPDEDALGLNTDDHFAYIIGYPDGTVQPNGQITRAEATTIFFRLLTEESRSANLTKTNGYTDVASDAWYNTAVSTMTKAGIVDGYPDGTFRPDAPITRAEMAKIISLFAKLDKSESRFSDIAGHWAEAYIKLAAGNGWIAGYPDGTFGPQRNITRAETATMINRVLDRVPSEESHLLSRGVMQIWPDANPGDWFYLAMQEATNSHDYERNAKWAAADEQWTALRETRDWKALEQ